MKPLLGFITVAALGASALAQSGGLINATRGVPQPNDPGGTTLWGTATVNTAGNAITAAANATGPVRIVIGGAGTSGNAVLASTGTLAPCTMDATLASAGSFYVIQGATAGQCHPQSAAPTAGTWVIGFLHDAATTSGSQALVQVNGFVYPGAGGGGASYPLTVSGTVNSGGIPYFSSATQQSTSAALTLNSPILGGGAGGAPLTVPGITTDGVSALNLGVSPTSVGKLVFANATSGTITLQPITGALGSSVYTLPVATGQVAVSTATTNFTAAQTFTGPVNMNGQAALTSPPAGINTPEGVVVVSSTIGIAARIQNGTVIRATWIGTCTSSAANASTFAIHYGTAGTTADGLMATATTAAAATSGSAIPFRAVMEITFQSGAPINAVGAGTLSVYNQGTTGIATTALQIINFTVPTTGTFNTNPVNSKFTLTYSSGASTTTATFTQAFLEFVNQ